MKPNKGNAKKKKKIKEARILLRIRCWLREIKGPDRVQSFNKNF